MQKKKLFIGIIGMLLYHLGCSFSGFSINRREYGRNAI